MTEDRRIRSVVILGGGSAGWMTAAALSQNIQRDCQITLVESEEIGIVGVGEATIPPIRIFNQMLGLDENEFLRQTRGTFKLGIQFINWGHQGNQYFHPFGSHGKAFDLLPIQHHWARARAAGKAAPLDEHSMAWAAASLGRFAQPSPDPRNVLSTYNYAYHFDASLYAAYLRHYAEARRVKRVEGKVASVDLHPETGHVRRLCLENGQHVEGELFIDCSGLRALLIEGALKTGYDDWTHWLPCNRALAMPCENTSPLLPYTKSTAHGSGWQWCIPLQHRTGNGHVYSSEHISDDEAADTLRKNLGGTVLGDPRLVRFTTGRRKKLWNKNVIAIGLSSGFLEPLESTSLHLIQAGISKLLAFFPDRDFDPIVVNEFNRIGIAEVERIRDFIILHYKLTQRDDTAFWRDCANMPIPDTLTSRIDHFRHYGRLIPAEMDLFGNDSWLAVHVGQGNLPERADPFLDYRNVDGADYLARLRQAMHAAAQTMPTHEAYIAQHCRFQ